MSSVDSPDKQLETVVGGTYPDCLTNLGLPQRRTGLLGGINRIEVEGHHVTFHLSQPLEYVTVMLYRMNHRVSAVPPTG